MLVSLLSSEPEPGGLAFICERRRDDFAFRGFVVVVGSDVSIQFVVGM
jgi:hypothetical protein